MEKVKHKFSSVEYFCKKYSILFKCTQTTMDTLHEEFIEYHVLDNAVLTEAQWNEALVCVNGADDTPGTKYYRMDIIWGLISERKRVDASPKIKYLSMVAKLVLCILIKLNKTPSRNSLNPNGTLL